MFMFIACTPMKDCRNHKITHAVADLPISPRSKNWNPRHGAFGHCKCNETRN